MGENHKKINNYNKIIIEKHYKENYKENYKKFYT